MRLFRAVFVGICVSAVASGCKEPVSPGDPVLVTLNFCDPANGALGLYPVPAWAAFKDGDRGWQRIQGNGSSFTFPMRSTLGGVSYVVVRSDSIVWHTLYGTRDEIRSMPGTCGVDGGFATAPITGSASSQVFTLRHGFARSTAISNPASTSISVDLPLSSTTADLLAVQTPLGSDVPARIIYRRNQAIAPGSTLPALDFTAAEAIKPDSISLALQYVAAGCPAVPGAQTRVQYGILTPTMAMQIGELNPPPPDDNLRVPVWQIPASRLGPEDRQYVTATEVHRCGTLGSLWTTRTTTAYLRSGYVNLYFFPYLTSPQWSRVTGRAYTSCRVEFRPQPEFDYTWMLSTRQSSVGLFEPRRIHEVVMTRAYRGDTVRLEPPDLSGVEGWKDDWGFSAALANSMLTTATASTSTRPWRFIGLPPDVKTLELSYTSSATLTC